jgi:tryptophanyl-tRNA synthetase
LLRLQVKEHAELMWLLSCFTPCGELNRMTQWKAKANNQATASLGLFAYPVLMAADILLYRYRGRAQPNAGRGPLPLPLPPPPDRSRARATHVPVGEDQVQHLELTRDIAKAMNNRFGVPLLVVPETVLGTLFY